MRTLFSLAFSLSLAAVIFLVLVTTGVLKIEHNNMVAKLKPVSEKVLSRAKTAWNALPKTSGETSQPVRQKVPMLPHAGDQASPAPTALPVKDESPTVNRRNFVHTRAVSFLSATAWNGVTDIEDRFTAFLMGELGVDDKETARIVCMSFWKNFVTLQYPWRAGEADAMQLAFAREKELKQAGFAAKGLTLMTSEFEEAEARFQELQRRLSGADAGGNTS